MSPASKSPKKTRKKAHSFDESLLYNIYIYYIVNVKYIYFSTLKPAPKKLSTEETEEFAVRVATTSLAFN